MKIIKKLPLLPFLLLTSLFAPLTQAEITPVNAVPDQATQWNNYVDKLLQLNKQLIAAREHITKTRTGGYSGKPEFYNEIQYYDAKTNLLTSTLRWEKNKPDVLHSIEINLRDETGRVTRDYSASYLTTHHNAPIQTLITLHYYNGDLHAFRSFDASHNRLYEVCKGTFEGKPAKIDLDDDYGEVAQAMANKAGIMSSPLYQACFGGRNVDKTLLEIPTF